jgi:hypothetical protein
MQNVDGARRQKLGALNQNLIREDKNVTIDSANEKDIANMLFLEQKSLIRYIYSNPNQNTRSLMRRSKIFGIVICLVDDMYVN